jgi:glycosyltransferase involved in cell wall biosynthesis
MTAMVAALLADQNEHRRRSLMGRQHARAFTWERAARATLEVYERVLEAR